MANDAISIDVHNVISSNSLVNVLRETMQTIKRTPNMSNILPALMLRGAPGIGKSTIVRSVAEELGIGFRDVRLAQLERVDFAGIPSVSKSGNTVWNIPSFWPTESEPFGIILLDEITSAPADVQVAAYSLVLDRKIPNSNYKLPDGWYIVAAGNRREDRAVVKSMSSALANRFVHLELEANPEEWFAWAIRNDIDQSVLGFLKFRSSLLFSMDNQNLECGWPSPRSWERVSNVLPMFRGNDTVLEKMVYGLVGAPAGAEYLAFYKLNKKFKDVLEMMVNPDVEIDIPQKMDEKCALATSAVYLLWGAADNEKETKRRVEGFFRIVDAMTDNGLALFMAKLAMVGTKTLPPMKAAAYIMKSDGYKNFAAAHKTAKLEEYVI